MAETEVPWAYRPILGPLSATDILSIAGQALAPLHWGYYKPYLPLALTGQLLEGKQAEYEQGQAVRQVFGPLYEKTVGQPLPDVPVPLKAIEPISTLIRAQTPKVDFTPAQQEEWANTVNAVPDEVLPPKMKQMAIIAGPERGRQAVGVWAPNAIPLPLDVEEQKRRIQLEPVETRITGTQQLEEYKAGERSLLEQQKAEYERQIEELKGQLNQQLEETKAGYRGEEERKKRETAGHVEAAKKDAGLIAKYREQQPQLDQSIDVTGKLRDLAAKIETGVLSGNQWVVAARQVFGDTDIALFDQLLKQAALPSIKPLLGSSNISDADRDAVLSMLAGRTIPTAANVASIDNVLRGLNAMKRYTSAAQVYFAQAGNLRIFATQSETAKLTDRTAPGGVRLVPNVYYVGSAAPGHRIYEDFATGKRYLKDPQGTWGETNIGL